MQTNVKLLRKQTIAEGTMEFYFSKPKGFEFRAGQFADYTLNDPPVTDPEGNTRGSSLVQAPYEPDLLAATRMRSTAFKRVLKDLPVGTEVALDAPHGDFTLHKTVGGPAVAGRLRAVGQGQPELHVRHHRRVPTRWVARRAWTG